MKRGIANVGCMMGVWRFKDGVNVLWKVGVGGWCICGKMNGFALVRGFLCVG